MTRPLLLRIGAVAAATAVASAALVLGGAAAALAHVGVSSTSSTPGERATLTFRVPTESDSASTVGLDIHLPEDTPFASVRVKPVAGWTVELVETDLPEPLTDAHGNTVTSAVTEIVWTATDGGLGPDQYGEFEVSVSPLPDAGTLYFPTVQTYSDGAEVGWVQQTEEGADEPEHPAPSLAVGQASDGELAASTSSSNTEDHGAQVTAASESSDTSALGVWSLAFSIGAFAVALVAAGLGGRALARAHR